MTSCEDEGVVVDLGFMFTNRNYVDTTVTTKCVSPDVPPVTVSLRTLSAACTDFDLTGQIVWPAAHVLCAYLIQNSALLEGKRVLELGAGTGLPSLVAAATGKPALMVASDHNDTVLELITTNIELNSSAASSLSVPSSFDSTSGGGGNGSGNEGCLSLCVAAKVTWGEPWSVTARSVNAALLAVGRAPTFIEDSQGEGPREGKDQEEQEGKERKRRGGGGGEGETKPHSGSSRFEVVIGADVTYFSEHVGALFDSVSKALVDEPGAPFILAHKSRWGVVDTALKDVMAKCGFECEQVPLEEFMEPPFPEDCSLTILRRKAVS